VVDAVRIMARQEDSKAHELIEAVTEPETVNFVPSTSGKEKSDESDGSSVQVKLEASGIAFEVNTQVAKSNQIVDLGARLDLVLNQLSEAQLKLELAHERIGYLEAQVQQRDQIIDRLCKDSSK